MFRQGRTFRPDFAAQCRRYLVEETEAFLDGRLASLVVDGEAPLPAWIEINWLAHAPTVDLKAFDLETGLSSRPGSWSWARAVLLREMLDRTGGDEAAILDCQRRCLVPVELDLMDSVLRWASPQEVVIAITGRLVRAAGGHGVAGEGLGD